MTKTERASEGVWRREGSEKWNITINWHGRHNFSAYSDAKLSARLRQDLQRLTERHDAGETIPKDLPQRQREILALLRIIKPQTRKSTDLTTLINLRCQIVRGTEDHKQRNMSRLMAWAQTINTIEDINADDTQIYIDRLKTSVSTKNHTLRTIKSFTAWLWRSHYLPNDPLAELSLANAAVDQRVYRRPITDAEFARLLTATIGPGLLPAESRKLVYEVARFSGLRASEIAAITPEKLEGRAIVMDAVDTKNGEHVRQPIPGWLAGKLQEFAAGKAGKLFPGNWRRRAAQMLRVDLAAAQIPYKDARGHQLDFHALRHSYVTGLARKGVTPQILQKLARHSTIQLTLSVYTHLDDETLAKTVEETMG